ncbi:MAG: DUF4349 domain-containing protein [Clostridia bacterium]|nr:DUF4349 domain-containing protein [Clostridia bacterium]
MKKHLTSLLAVVSALILIFSLAACSNADTKAETLFPNAADKEIMDGMTSSDAIAGTSKPESTPDYERKIIRTVDLSCETKSFEAASEHLMSVLASHGGYVETSTVSGSGYNEEYRASRYATYTLRVPAEQLDAFLLALSAEDGIRIIRQSSNSNEITNQYYDITTRLATLETEREALSQMLAGFSDYKDINAMLSVQERLYNVIEEIEALKTRLNLYDQQVDLSTVNISLNEVGTYTEAATPTFGERIGEAFSESWKDFARGCQSFAVGFVASIPTLLVLAAVAAVAVTVLVQILKKRRKKKAERENEIK